MNTATATTRVSFRNILYATDFSPASEAALPYAKGIAQQYSGKVHALHVRFPATYPIVGPEAMPQIIEAAEEQAKLEAQQLHSMFEGIPHDVTIGEGDLWPTLNKVLRDEAMDLIVLGTHGRTGLGRVLMGSVAEEIFRKAACPVLTVGPHVSKEAERRLEMREILFATDFSPESQRALPYAVSMAQEHQARLTLMNVAIAPKTGDLVNPQHFSEITLRQLQKLVPREAGWWCEPRFVVEHGQAAEKILEVALAIGADLIVLGVRGAEGKMGVATHLANPTAHRIVTKARCPVMTVRG